MEGITMDVREKLVEILKQAPFEGKVLDEWWWEEKIVRIVDHLIANGITVQDNTEISDEILEQLRNAPVTVMKEESTVEVVQEWISVKDRLPEDLEENKGKKVINCIVEHDPYGNGKTTAQFRQRKYDKYYDKWYWSKIGGCTVIRWTMMPQPPKGE
jgi:polyhydroxyalkanoate synthesis regulator phasin